MLSVTRLATTYLMLAAVYLIFGLSLEIAARLTHATELSALRLDVSLIGWTSHGLMGVCYRLWPGLEKISLATAQGALFMVSAPIFILGWMLANSLDPPLIAIAGSIGVFIGAVLFAIMFVRLWLSSETTGEI